jgi:hypothetical protein
LRQVGATGDGVGCAATAPLDGSIGEENKWVIDDFVEALPSACCY